LVGEEVVGGAGDFRWGVGEAAAADGLEEAEVSFFLTGDEVVDEHRAAGGDGFVDGGSAGFTNGEVVGVEELRDSAGPADETDTTRKG
jgi:hypothetical protein